MDSVICIINKTSDANSTRTLSEIARALDGQVRRHVCPAWGRARVKVIAVAHEADAPLGSFPLYLFETPDAANALGYHDETPDGQIYGKVFTVPIFDNGGSWYSGPLSVSVTLSHEAIEIVGDPNCNEWVQDFSGRLYARELCDPVESDAYIVTTRGKPIYVSNFVFPAWFDAHPPAHAAFDYLGTTLAPFQAAPGGYYIWESDPGNVQEFFNHALPAWKRDLKAFPAARTARRKHTVQAVS